MSRDRINQLHPVHRLIQALGRDPAVQQRFGADAGKVFLEFGLSADEVAALRDGSIPALAKIGVNPMLRMHWLLITNPAAAEQMSVSEYLPTFNEEVR